jgi:SPP1 gp7 family putative phage head morphogenesis protein
MSLQSKLEQFDKQSDKLSDLTEKELIKAYSLSLKEIRGYMAEVYEKYGTPDGLPYSEMQRYNRMKSLEEQIKKILFELTGKNAKTLEQTLKDIYELSYYSTGFALESESQVKLSYAMINKEVVNQSVQNPISGLTLNDRLEKNRIELIYRVRQEITQGLILGESYQKIAKRLKDTFEGDVKKSIRVAQTEAHRIKNTARYESLQHAQAKGIELKKVWVSTLDKKTRDRHRSLDGQKVDVDQPFKSGGAEAMYPSGFGVASQDVNCRCTFISVLDGFEPTVRASRGEDGKTKVIPYTTYEDWHKARIKG